MANFSFSGISMIIKNSKFMKWLVDFGNSNAVAKIIVSLIIWVCALVPVWLYLLARWLIDPFGFWQELAIFLIFAVCIGWLQALLALIGIGLTVALILDDI